MPDLRRALITTATTITMARATSAMANRCARSRVVELSGDIATTAGAISTRPGSSP